MPFDRSVIPHPTGTTPVVAAMAALVLSVAFVPARRAPARVGSASGSSADWRALHSVYFW